MKSFKVQLNMKPNCFEDYRNNRLKFARDEPVTETELFLKTKNYRTLMKNYAESFTAKEILLDFV